MLTTVELVWRVNVITPGLPVDIIAITAFTLVPVDIHPHSMPDHSLDAVGKLPAVLPADQVSVAELKLKIIAEPAVAEVDAATI